MGDERTDAAVSGDVAAIFTTECEKMNLNSSMEVRENYCYSFTPEQSGTYTLWSQGSTEALDLHGYLFDSEQHLLQENDNCGEMDFNFSMYYEMEAGQTYYLVIDVKGEQGGNAEERRNAGFSVTVSETLQDEIKVPESETEQETQQTEADERMTETETGEGKTGLGTSETGMETETEAETETGAETESESETETSVLTVITGQLLKQGIGFAAGLFVAAAIALFMKGRRKNKRNNSEKSRIRVVEEEKIVQSEKSRIGKIHGIGARNDQQDSFYADELTDVKNAKPGDMLAIVADGMGGLQNGAIVSNTVVKVCVDTFYQSIETMDPTDAILEMALNVNKEVNRILQNTERSGSTMVIGVIWQGMLYFLTIGDSRIWLWRSGGLIQLNREHNYQEELALKVINNQGDLHSVHLDPQRRNLTSYVGQGMIKYVDRNTGGILLKKGDKVLLTSDGVFGTIDERKLEQLLKQPAQSAAQSIHDTIGTSNRPHQDNYTAVILEYNE
ncbi:MAG: serine/threonine-protein phosphatase [Eubacteriales bacterium]|nr:serine/threonine-protein phosphatase [Eubacteriales bacterium]